MCNGNLGTIDAVVTSDAGDVIERETGRSRQPTRVAKRRDMTPEIRPRGGHSVGASECYALQHGP